MKHEEQTVESQIAKILRVELLPNLVSILDSFPAAQKMLGQVLRLAVVIDANIVHEELWWRLKNRPSPEMRSGLETALLSGVLVAYAPHHLEAEIRGHVARLAKRTKRSVTEVEAEWQAFRRHIHFHTGQLGQAGKLSDPDDTAYVDTFRELAVRGVYTRDHHFLASGAPLIYVAMGQPNPVGAALRRYAESSTVRVGLAMGSSMSLVVSFEALVALGKVLKALAKAFRRMPPLAQVVLAGGVAALLAHPKSRKKLQEMWDVFRESVKPTLWNAAVEAMNEFSVVTECADKAYREIEVLLPEATRRSLIAHARAVCLAEGTPLSEKALLRKATVNGYVPRGNGSTRYLRKVLRADRGFIETGDGWRVRTRIPT